MPVYCYDDDKGNVIERVFPCGHAPKSVRVKEKTFHRSFYAEKKGVPSSKCWPMECIASGVNAEQASELRAHLAGKGVPTEVSKDGNPIYTSAAHRRKALKARGMFDRKSYI